jgi:hypothetical protein
LVLSEKDLEKLCSAIEPVMAPDVYVYCSFPDFGLPDGLAVLCTIREQEGLTAIVRRADAQRLSLPYTFDARLITLTVHSSLEAVGFLAMITARLAQADIPCNAIAGYYHDHILVPVDRADEALTLLDQLSVPAE